MKQDLVPQDLVAIGRRIRAQRIRQNASQTSLANQVGVSTRLWSETERGERPNISFTTLTRMLDAVDLQYGLQETNHSRQRDDEVQGWNASRALLEAESFGIDISLLRASLHQTMRQRLEDNDDALESFQQITVTPGAASQVLVPAGRHKGLKR